MDLVRGTVAVLRHDLRSDVADARKHCAILLNCCGASSVYSLIWSLAASSKPTDIAYKELVEKVMAYFQENYLFAYFQVGSLKIQV